MLRQSLHRFVHGRKVKVSLFLQNNLQNLDGSFALSSVKGHVGLGSEVPGSIRYVVSRGLADKLAYVQHLYSFSYYIYHVISCLGIAAITTKISWIMKVHLITKLPMSANASLSSLPSIHHLVSHELVLYRSRHSASSLLSLPSQVHPSLTGMNLYDKDVGKVIDMATLKPPACAASDVAKALAMQLKGLYENHSSSGPASVGSRHHLLVFGCPTRFSFLSFIVHHAFVAIIIGVSFIHL